MILILKILGLFVLHWLVHYKVFICITKITGGRFDDNDRKVLFFIALAPVIATGLLVFGLIIILNDKFKEKRKKIGKPSNNFFYDFLHFIDDFGVAQYKWLKKRDEARKEKIKIRKEKIKAEKDNYTRFEALDL